jgi:hypothetical protein
VSFVSDLDTPLLQLSLHDPFTLRDACAGVHIFGGIGSGKTSGSGKALAGAYLRAGMGGLVLCAKPEEVALWKAYLKANGREKSLVLFDETQGFNFIDYELARQGLAGIGNVTECLMRVLEAADHTTGAGGVSSDPFWAQATRQVLNYTIPLLYCAHGAVTVGSIIDFVVSAAPKAAQYSDDDWCKTSLAARTLRRAAENAVVPMDRHGQRAMLDYWFNQYPAIPEKTRGNIVISLSAKLDRFKHGRLQRSFCDHTSIVPELTFHGAIILMAMPALTWNEDGIIAQQLFKFMWQRAVESRNGLDPKHSARPVFLWADESQYFVNVKDDEFLSTCRGSKACVVFLTQTLPTYYARMGKDKSDAADGLVGKFSTQVFHQNACNRTNSFASQLIGRGIHLRSNQSYSEGKSKGYGINVGGSVSTGYSSGSGSSTNSHGDTTNSRNSGSNYSESSSWGQSLNRGSTNGMSWGSSEQMDNLIEPNFFAHALKSGGKPHGNIVTALWFKAGGNFRAADGNNHMVTAFKQ